VSAVDDRLRDKMPSVGTLPLLYNAVVVPKLLFEVGNRQSEANVVYWRVLLRGLMSAVARCHEAAHLSRNRFTVPPTDNSAAAGALERV